MDEKADRAIPNEPPAPTVHTSYFPHLDGARALAVMAVLIEHFFAPPVIQHIGFGAIGVKVFFVLSGYLISRIIFGYKSRGTSIGAAAAPFYWRRFLRLSPPFYLALAVAFALNLGTVRMDWPFHATYLTNFLAVAKDGKLVGLHLWSLAVEEQFYLLWFFLLMATPWRAVVPLVIAACVLGPAYRAALYFFDQPTIANWLLPGSLDSLALGALLAYAEQTRSAALKQFIDIVQKPVVLIVAAVAIVALGLGFAWESLPKRVLYPMAINVAALSLIAALTGPLAPPLLYRWLSLSPLRWVGKISYGIYVYHGFLPEIFRMYFPNLLGTGGPVRALCLAVLSIIIAAASWFLIEQPCLRLKNLVSAPRTRPVIA